LTLGKIKLIYRIDDYFVLFENLTKKFIKNTLFLLFLLFNEKKFVDYRYFNDFLINFYLIIWSQERMLNVFSFFLINKKRIFFFQFL